jgi:heavy metal sensor kinase
MKALPIRLRLTCWYFAMFASAATLLCLTSLWMLQRSVDETEYHEMQERIDDVRVVLGHEGTDRSLQQVSNDIAAIYSLKDDGKYLQVRDEEGNWVFRSKRMIEENLDLPSPAGLPKAGSVADFHLGVHHVRALALPIVARGQGYSVQTGIALDKSIAVLTNFRTNLLLLTPMMILIAAVGGHAMSRKALRPVAELAAEVQRINDRNLDTRLPVSNAKDEISDLSRTLNQMLERIEKAFASVRAFTGNASHELRTPITLLRTEIEVALYRPRKADEYRATLSRLHEEAVRITNLVENLLSLARADGGAETISIGPIQVSHLLQQVTETWESTMNQSMLEFTAEIPDDRLVVLGDEHGVQRVLSILLENAAKFTPPGGVVRLYTAVDKAQVIFCVQDTGFGIAPEHKLRIFDRFYRAAPDGGSSGEGSGLGLALAKWIVERHGTGLSVESEPGCGSCFSFKLEKVNSTHPTANSLTSTWTDSERHGKLCRGNALPSKPQKEE